MMWLRAREGNECMAGHRPYPPLTGRRAQVQTGGAERQDGRAALQDLSRHRLAAAGAGLRQIG
jgi:hypothetical protein